jgi:hypothetical protein
MKINELRVKPAFDVVVVGVAADVPKEVVVFVDAFEPYFVH